MFTPAWSDAVDITTSGQESDGLSEIEEYALSYGLNLDQAAWEMRVPPTMSAIIRGVEIAAGRSFANVKYVHSPNLGLQVSVGPAGPMAAIKAAVASSPIPVSIRTVPISLEGLLALDADSSEWVDTFPQIAGIAYEADRGAIELNTIGSSSIENDAMRNLLNLRYSDSGVEFLTHTLAEGSQGGDTDQVRGGLELLTRSGGTKACTIGFVVRGTSGATDGLRGFVDAGHCSDSLDWREFGGSAQGATLQSQIDDDKRDLAWRRGIASENPIFKAEYFGALTTSASDVRGQYSVSEMDGIFACHRGSRTGFSCGEVTNTSYKPVYPNACNTNLSTGCGPYFVKVSRTSSGSLACFPGDSGGPFAVGGYALGIDKGGFWTGAGSGECSEAWFTPIGRIRQLNVELVVKP